MSLTPFFYTGISIDASLGRIEIQILFLDTGYKFA